MKKLIKSTLLAAAIAGTSFASAATYIIDDYKAGAHAQIDVQVKHLGFSWVKGRFDNFSGTFEYDKAKPNESKIEVNIDTTSFDSNHAKRDKHITGSDFLDVAKYPNAFFRSTKIESMGGSDLKVTGDLTLHGVTQSITFDAQLIGEGGTPWGDYRAGFEATATLKFADFKINGGKIGQTDFIVNMFFEGVTK